MSEAVQRRLAAIMAADVVSYSRLMGADEAGTLAALRQIRSGTFDPTVSGHRGKIVKSMGDGWLVEFESAIDAVSCAIGIQEQLAGHENLKLRIGLHIGDITHADGDIFGDGVNIAARLQEIAEPGAIVISDMAQRSIDGKLAAAFNDLGAQELKNIAVSVTAYGWGMESQPNKSAPMPLPDKPSIAVLPFDNMSGDPEQEYFSDGITEDIITDLSKISALFVIARNSAFTYKGRAIDVRQAAEELGVTYILEGSVRRAGNRLRITAQLIEGTSAGHLWAERFDRELDDIFAIQDEITREVVDALKVTLNLDENARLGKVATNNIAAYDLALRGMSLMYHHNQQGTFEAQGLFEQAIALDPNYVAPHFGLAVVLNTKYVNGWRDTPQDTLQRAFEVAQRAVVIDPLDPQGHWALALSHLWQRDLDKAIAAARRAIELGPNYAEAFAIHGYVLSYAGEPAKAIESLRSAMRLDPQYTEMWLHFLGHAQFIAGDYQQAAETLQRRITRNPSTDISRVLLASCFGHLGRESEAQALWAEALEINPDYSIEQKARILPYKYPADWERFASGLHKAGVLPE